MCNSTVYDKETLILPQIFPYIAFIYLRLNEGKRNERDGKWFLEFPGSEMIEYRSVVIVNVREA